MGHPIFVVDAVIGQGAQVLGTFAGAVEDVERPVGLSQNVVPMSSWTPNPSMSLLSDCLADFHYGPGMGRNPILVAQAIGATIARISGILRFGGVVVVAARCGGYFNDQWFPSYRGTFARWAEYCSVSEMTEVMAEMSTRPEFIRSLP